MCIRDRFYSLLAISTLIFNKAPYKNVIVLGHVQDENGQKMSKSKGLSLIHILSRRLSFVRPLRRLYCRVVMPDQARVISSVRIAYSIPAFTPRSCHSSVSSLRT